jgi:uncharacterized protein (DUF433 family)
MEAHRTTGVPTSFHSRVIGWRDKTVTMDKEGNVMASSIDWSQCPAVESVPGKVSGAWVFRGTRVPLSVIFENLKTSPLEEILENFPVTREQVQSVLDFAAKSGQAPLEHRRAG